MFKKIVGILLSLTLLLCAVPMAGVLAADTNGLSITDNGFYSTKTPVTELPQVIEAEIKLTAAQCSRTGMLFSNWYYKNYTFYEVAVNEKGQPYLYWQKNSNVTAEKLTFTDVTVDTGEWLTLKIAADFDKGEVYCYVNGALKQTLTTTYTAFPLESVFSVGNNLRQGHGYNWRGEIRALTVSGANSTLAHYDLAGKAEGDLLKDTVGGHDAVWEQLWFDTRPAVGEYDFSFAVVGDTQTLTKFHPATLPGLYTYIKDTAAEKKVAMAFTLGDLTDTGAGVKKEWDAITNAMNILDGVVPHNVMRGNHDHVDWYNEYITKEAYGDGVVTYDDTMNNYYREITIGGVDYLVVVFEYHPATAVQNWAKEIIAQHPDHRVIISTHDFTNPEGTYTSLGEVGDGPDLYHNVIKKFPNIVLVLSGHWSSQDVVMGKSKGEHGNVITHVLVDPQEVDQPIDGGAGLVAHFYFSNDGKDIEVEYYSPSRDQYYKMSNQYTFSLDLPWDENIPALSASDVGAVEEKEFCFTPQGLSAYSSGKYTANNKTYYSFPETETDIIDAIESKFHLYYDREGAVYTRRNLFTNGDGDGETRWILLQNAFLQRSVSAAGGSQLFRKIDSLVPINSLGQEIIATNFKTTFTARLEDENKGLVILGFRQQPAGQYTSGYYKLRRTQAFVAIGRKGLTVASGADILFKNGGDATTDMYNHLAISFDDTATQEVEMLPKNVAVTVEAHGTLCDVSIYDFDDRNTPLYTYTDLSVPYTTAGTFAYSVSDKNNSIGAISLEVYDDNGNVTDLATPSANGDPSALRFYGGDIRVDAEHTADGYLYTLTVDAADGYRLNTDTFYLEDTAGNKIVPTRVGNNTYTVSSHNGGAVTAVFEKGAAAPVLTAPTGEAETFAFTPQGLSPYENNKYTASGKQYYAFPETETDIVNAIESKFHLYYNRESVVYAQRDLFTNNDTAQSRWLLLYDAFLQRSSGKTSGEIFRKIDSLVPLNSMGEEIRLTNFETTYNVRFENENYGAVILGFRQQTPGRFVTGYYKMPQDQAFVAIGRKGMTVAGGSDIVAKSGGTSANDMYNHFKTSFDDPNTEEAEMLPQQVTVKVRAVGTNVKVWIYASGQTEAVYTQEVEVPYTAAGTLAYAVSAVGHDIGAISLTKLDENGKAIDIATNEPNNAFDLTYRGGTISYAVEETADAFAYTLDVQPNAAYELLSGSLYVTDSNGQKIIPTRVGFRETEDGTKYTFTATADGVVSATFVKPTVETPNIGNIGTSINQTVNGLRFVTRAAVAVDGDNAYMTLNGKTCTVTDYGMLIGVSSVIGEDALTTELAKTNTYVKQLSVKQSKIYYDLWDAGVDMSVCVTGLDRVDNGENIELTARAYVTAVIGGQEVTLYTDPFTSTFNKNM